MLNNSLGTRMKLYESVLGKIQLPVKSFTLIRVDGKSFHTYTKHLKIPFDKDFHKAMDETAIELCKQMSGSLGAYVQSDEISILLSNSKQKKTEAMYNNNLQKLVSISASVATAAFNKCRITQDPARCNEKLAHFDSRAFTIPLASEVDSYFIWRQDDAMRNAISSIARSRFSHKELECKTSAERIKLIEESGDSLSNYDPGNLQGRIVVQESVLKEVSFTRNGMSDVEKIQIARSIWTSKAAPRFRDSRPQYLFDFSQNIQEVSDGSK